MARRSRIVRVGQNLATLPHGLERRPRAGLIPRGAPASVMPPARGFHSVTPSGGRFWDVYEAFRETVALPPLGLDPTILEGARDRSAGREVELSL